MQRAISRSNPSSRKSFSNRRDGPPQIVEDADDGEWMMQPVSAYTIKKASYKLYSLHTGWPAIQKLHDYNALSVL